MGRNRLVINLIAVVFLIFPSAALLDISRTIVWGPGLGENHLPVRYFFVQFVNNAGENVTESQHITLDIQLVGQSQDKIGGKKCRYHLEQLDAGDGSIVVRYRIFHECTRASLHIKYQDDHVADSPYDFQSSLFPEVCSCAVEIQDFCQKWKCPEKHSQIEKDLATFSNINYTHVQREMLKKFSTDNPESLAICQYVVKSGEIYRKCFGRHVGFSMFMDATLLSILRKVKLPDFEFFVNLGDWPVSHKGKKSPSKEPWPIFSWCGSYDSFDIVMPNYDITESTLEAMNRVSMDILSVQKSEKMWADKIPKAFFRGRDANRERLKSVNLSRKHPDLLDSAITNFFFYRDEENIYGPKSPRVPFTDFFTHKYQVSFDGTVASYRFPYLLAGDSVVLKQDSHYYEHFYSSLKPNEHYIPFRRDLSDLIEKISWAKAHDTTVHKIARDARAFVRDNLLPEDIYCYYILLFERWSQLTSHHEVLVTSEMEKISQPQGSFECSCLKKTPQHSEL